MNLLKWIKNLFVKTPKTEAPTFMSHNLEIIAGYELYKPKHKKED